LDFQKFEILTAAKVYGETMCVNVPNLTAVGQTISKIWHFIDFSTWRPSAILDLLYACFDNSRTVFGGLYGLKMPIHAQF